MRATARPGWGRGALLVGALAVAAAFYLTGTNLAVSQTTALDARRVGDDPGLDPDAGVWDRAPAVETPMTAQAVAYPFGGGSVPVMDVRALHDGDTLFLRVEWEDDTLDDTTIRAEDFSDGVAVEFPAEGASSVPAVCMGQADAGVNIWQWRADRAGNLPQDAPELHPDAYVDLYPSTDDLYFPARNVGNPQAATDGPAVQNLVAQGFGTLEPAADQPVSGTGRWEDNRWSVVLARPFDAGADTQPTFTTSGEIDVAFAVWNGSEEDRNGQKSVSSFVRLSLADEALPPEPLDETYVLMGLVAVIVAVAVPTIWSTVRQRGTP